MNIDWGEGPASLALKGEGELNRKRALLRNFLSTGGQELSLVSFSKFLDRPNSLELLLSFITRDETPLVLAEDFNEKRYSIPFVYPAIKPAPQDCDDDVKRAFNAVQLLCGKHEPVDFVLVRRAAEVAAAAIRAFRAPKSQASVFHVCALLEHVLSLNPEAVIGYLSEGPRMRLCMGAMLENCHIPKVVDVVFNILSQRVRPPNMGMDGFSVRPETLKVFHKRLLSWGPLAILVERITSAEADEPRAFGWADLITRVVADFDIAPEGEEQGDPALLKPLTNSKLVEAVVRCACAKQLQEQRAEAALHLLSVLTSVVVGKPLAVQAPPVAPQDKSNTTEIFLPEVRRPHRLVKLAGEFANAMAPHVALLCEALDEASYERTLRRHSSYELESPFTFRRLTLIRALVAVAVTPAALSSVPWESMCRMRMRYTNNTMFQNEFFTLFDRALKCDYQSSPLRPVLEKMGFLEQLVVRADRFRQDSDHAHALQCLNLLRLRAQQLEEGHWLVDLLEENEEYQDAVPELCRQTRRMLLPLKVPPAPDDHAGAAHALQSVFDRDNPLSSDLASSFDQLAEEEALSSLDIDTGSAFAKALGFQKITLVDPDAVSAAEAAKRKEKKERKKKAKGKKRR